jgi:hypothetical protein
MKHILNDISQEEKNRILEQHSGGKTIDTTKFKRLLESTMGNVKPLISEQAAKQVAGPFGVAPLQYYIFDNNGKFFIYQTNATVKTPTLLPGTEWNNNGPGYDTQQEANMVIQRQLTPKKKSGSYQNTEDKPTIVRGMD